MKYAREKILITVKTYPHPSLSYQELVCTAGVREDGSFVRLYPIDYRYMGYWQWYKKYQWIDVDIAKNTKDPRKESYAPRVDSIKPASNVLSTKKCWADRKQFVLARGTSSMEVLHARQVEDNSSLGIIRPRIVNDFIVEETEREWKPKWRQALNQHWLFGPGKKPLEKIPYKFSYSFECDDSCCSGHKMMIEDWEVGQLYLKMRDKFRDEKVAIEKVRERFFDTMCAPKIDTHFFVGTVLSHGTWIILGVFWPKKNGA